MKSISRVIGEGFSAARIPYLLVGGCAINAYGFERATDDIDILIRDEDRSRAVHVLELHGFAEHRHGDVVSRMMPKDPGIPMVDLMPVDANTFSLMFAESHETEFEGVRHRIPTAHHLMAMKLHALRHGHEARRNKDALDVLELARTTNMDIHSESFRNLCLKFGGQGVYNFLSNFGRPL